MILILSYDDHLIIIWPLSSSLTMNFNSLRFALFSPYSKLPMMQTSFPHIIIGHCFYASEHHLAQFQEQFLRVQGHSMPLCTFWCNFLHGYTTLEGNFCVCKGILCFFALVGAISRAISVCARALYVSILLCVQGQFILCVQGQFMLLCTFWSNFNVISVVQFLCAKAI